MPKPTFEIALALVQRGEQWLVAKRRPGVHLGGQWEFPGGKHNARETPAQAAIRELREECGVEAVPQRVFDTLTCEYEDRIVYLTPVLCRWQQGKPQPLSGEICRWVSADELRRLDMPAINTEIIRAVLGPVR